MKKLILVMLCLTLGSCITFNNAPPGVVIAKDNSCTPFKLPDFEAIPQIPELSESTVKDRHLSEEALLNIIVEHRRYIRQEHDALNEAYIAHLQHCN